MQPIELMWLGQAGFLIDADVRILIDPFMSEYESRLYPPPKVDVLPDRIEWLLATHEHLDHLDTEFLPQLVERCPGVRLVLPRAIAPQVEGLIRPEKIRGVQPGDTIALSEAVSLEVIPAYHGSTVADGYTDGSAPGGRVRFVGYVVRTPNVSVYHAGDTIVTDELLAALDGKRIDVALLPINGRDYFREHAGLVGNMNFREAVHLAHEIGVRTMVPIHWDLFAGNSERPGAVIDAALEIGAGFHVLTLARLVRCRIA